MFVKKDTSELRFVVDFRAIYAVNMAEGSNIPHFRDMISSLSESRYFTFCGPYSFPTKFEQSVFDNGTPGAQ